MIVCDHETWTPAVPGPASPSNRDGGHQPVLVDETLAALNPRTSGRYLDGTFGGGGHTRAILDASAPSGVVLALDADPAAIARGRALAEDDEYRSRLIVIHANFSSLSSVAETHGFVPLDGVLLDLGLSSFQLADADRGFSFQLDGPLDMRFDPATEMSAADIIHTASEAELSRILFEYGDERRSRQIAAAIGRERAKTTIDSTAHLASVIERATGGRKGARTHPATRSFQALRIAVNAELDVLAKALHDAVAILAPRGRLAVITFHSLEDRIVKRFIADQAATCTCPAEQPVCTCAATPLLRKVGGAIRPSAPEVTSNPRSRSATLRVAERREAVNGEEIAHDTSVD